MTVSSTTTKKSYSGDGSTTVFAYTFKIFDEDDISVILRNDSTGAETVQTKTTHYTVSGVGDSNGGNVTFVTAPTSSQTVVLLRATARTQATDYTPNDPFPAASHEDALDKLTFIAQELEEELGRAIKVSKTNTIDSTEFTIGATDRANKIFAFDSDGDFAVTQEIGTYKGTDATTTTSAYKERDLIKSTTAAQLDNVYICVADSVAGDLLTDTDHFELLVDAVTAATSATNAASSASAAATSATNAATSATTATTQATAASTSATSAETAKTAAETAQTAAETAQTAAETAQTAAETAQTAAETAETNAETAETNAATSETNASTSATAAATSATNAATSATTATTQATAASTSATNAATSETNAATSATNAATSATNAATSETNTTNLYNSFSATYRTGATDPTTSLDEGDLFYNTTANVLKYYNGTAWVAVQPGITQETDPNALAFSIALG